MSGLQKTTGSSAASPDGAPGSGKGVLAGCVFVLLLVIAFIVFDSRWRLREVERATEFRFPSAVSKLPSGAQSQRNVMLPPAALDSRWWIIYAEDMARTGKWRIRENSYDNAPDGREVHWSSLPVWILTGIARAAEGGPESFQRAATYFGPVTLLAVLLLLVPVLWRLMGAIPAATFALGCVGVAAIFGAFRAGEADHHGLVAMCSFASVFFIIAGGAGGRSPQSPSWPGAARAAWLFAISGVTGAAGLWISSASQLPVIVGCGVGALLIAGISRRTGDWEQAPQLWRLWGWCGGGASLAFYLLEYFPSHMGLRLEVNHPLYSLAWVGGGELLFRLTRWISRKGPLSRGLGEFAILGLAVAAAVAPLLLILSRGESVFVVSNHFLFALHKHYILEFQNFLYMSRQPGMGAAVVGSLLWPGVVGGFACYLLFRRRITGLRKAQIVFSLIPAIGFQCLAFAQVRWGTSASALWLVTLVVETAAVVDLLREKQIARPALLAWAASLALALGISPLRSFLAGHERKDSTALDREWIRSVIVRDVAHGAIEPRGNERPTILAGPNTTTELIYFGGFRGIGSLYWENLAGLRAAAEMYSATDARSFLALLKKHQITHLVFFSWDSFAQSYVGLARDLGRDTEIKDGYIAGLLEGRQPPPVWLSPIYYPLTPAITGDANLWARIYLVVPDQTPAQWSHAVGVYQLQLGKLDLAVTSFRAALVSDPGNTQTAAALAVALFALDQRAEAAKVVRAALQSGSPGATSEFEDMAKAFARTARIEQARLVFGQIEQHHLEHQDSQRATAIRQQIEALPRQQDRDRK